MYAHFFFVNAEKGSFDKDGKHDEEKNEYEKLSTCTETMVPKNNSSINNKSDDNNNSNTNYTNKSSAKINKPLFDKKKVLLETYNIIRKLRE